MESSTTAIQGARDFYASKKNSLTLTRWGLWSGATIGIALSALSGKRASIWPVALFMLMFVALLDWFIRKQQHTGKVLISVDADGISSPVFNGKIKRYEWRSVAEITLTRLQNVPTLQLVLNPSLGQPNKKSFWTGLNPAKPTLPLSALDEASQAQLLEAIQQRRQAHAVFLAPAKINNEIAEEKAFADRLKALTPTPWVTYCLIATNILLWVATLAKGGTVAGTPADLLLQWGGNAASEVQRGEWWRMASSMFLHNGMMHIALNMLGLYSVGITVERLYGPRLFALIYLGSGLVGSALSLHFAAQAAVSVGASGAVFGIAGALVVGIWEHRRQLPRSISKQTLVNAGIFILYSLAQGFAQQGIDNAAHIGGLLAGSVLAYLLPEQLDPDRYERTVRRKALMALTMVLAAAAGLATAAPQARLDQRGVQHFTKGLRAMSNAFNAFQQEAEQVKAGKRSERELDERSRTVYAPMMRQALMELSQAQLATSDPRHPMLVDATRMSELLLESLAMESVFPAGPDKPEPADPARAEAIARELKTVSEHFVSLQSKK
ncbi:rhomboid family intramembrane serine protease [Rhodoferax mekongensis]|uniref:rhomboid family intramembrane serine protease n=1 Tax=Rhodoferax mekongensis TaxID=3068341 RepID=UPI0028BEC8E9|nr:rhomboid family intramembrane serine protease [Rhodoferax sp. TBRC 17199]MDT7513890.1 rhomboid family intramembrane serine protease [Rhodoferax sp. TBRC 17199]